VVAASIGEWVKIKSDFFLLKLELKGLGVKYHFIQNYLKFENYSDDLLRIAHLKNIGDRKTHYYQFVEEFGDFNNYSFHGIVPYKGKFYPRLPRNIINFFSLNEKDWILDPFCGCGTTNLEAQLMGINSFGLDISPYAYMISKIKTKLINININLIDVSESYLIQQFKAIENKTLNIKEDFWNQVLLFCYLDICDLISRINKSYQKFWLFKKKIKKIIQMIKKTQNLLNQNNIRPGESIILNESALNCDKLFNIKFDAIITSPPYFFSLDYLNRNEFFNRYFNINVNNKQEQELGRSSYKRINNYEEAFKYELGLVLKIFDKITKNNGKIGIIMGDSQFRGEKIKSTKFILEKGKNLGWKLEKIIKNPIIGKRTHKIFEENIILFSKI